MNELYELKDNLVETLKEYGRGEISSSSLNTIDKLAHAAKNVCKVIEACEDEEYSERGYSRGESGRYYRDGESGRYYRDGGTSRARGRRNARRDSMGRYSRTEDETHAKLMEIMDETNDENTRHAIQRMLGM